MEDVISMGSPVLILDQINACRNERKGNEGICWHPLKSVSGWTQLNWKKELQAKITGRITLTVWEYSLSSEKLSTHSPSQPPLKTDNSNKAEKIPQATKTLKCKTRRDRRSTLT